MSETETQREEETAGQETKASDKSTEATEEAKAAPIIWSQKRVPNIEKGYNPSVPFYMMGILVALIILSVILAKVTS